MNATITRRFARYVALPAVSAGIIVGSALGMAGAANAGTVGRPPARPLLRVCTNTIARPPAVVVPGHRRHHHHVPSSTCRPANSQTALRWRPSPLDLRGGTLHLTRAECRGRTPTPAAGRSSAVPNPPSLTSLMLASRRAINPSDVNSQSSLP